MNLPDEKKTKIPRHDKTDKDLLDDDLFLKQAPADLEGDTGREETTQDLPLRRS